MFNFDGSFSYSAVQAINVTAASNFQVAVYPNPATDYVTIRMNNGTAGKYTYTVSSMTGQVVTNAAVELSNGQALTIDLTKTGLRGLVVIGLRNAQTGVAETFSIVRK